MSFLPIGQNQIVDDWLLHYQSWSQKNFEIRKNITYSNLNLTTSPSLNECLSYALFPMGKGLRVKVSLHYFLSFLKANNLKKYEFILQDMHDSINLQKQHNQSDIESLPLLLKNWFYWSNFIEYHHAYTLVHDDMPCMDNDDWRRGKLSTHKMFGEWIALLVGDALLNESYSQLFLCQMPNSQNSQFCQFLQFAQRLCGMKGLILGQYMDLEMSKKNLEFDLLGNKQISNDWERFHRIYTLKTAYLFALSVSGGLWLSLCAIDSNRKFSVLSMEIRRAFRWGLQFGILFQLRDDYEDWKKIHELPPEKLTLSNREELRVNAWSQCYSHALDEVKRLLLSMQGPISFQDSSLLALLKDGLYFPQSPFDF